MSRTHASLLFLLAGCATARVEKPVEIAVAPVPAPVVVAPPIAWTRTPPPGPLTGVTPSPARVQEKTLGNGLRIVVVEHRRRPLVSVRLLFATGATAESNETAGVTSLALSLLCGSFETKNDQGELLVSDEKSARRQVVDVGGSLRSFVSADRSWLGIDGYSADAQTYLGTLNDVMKVSILSREMTFSGPVTMA